MRNNCIDMRYRSITRPRPLWSETAIYGGYKFIELTEDCWIPRTFEYLMLCVYSDAPLEVRELAKRELNVPSNFFHPSQFQQSDYHKLLYTLSRQSAIAISGYAAGMQSIIQRLAGCKIYTDSSYTFPETVTISTEQICKISSTLITLIPVTSTHLKSQIANWGNIIIYDEDMLVENNIGGQLCQQ